jgi:hypothetical protein
MSYNAGEKLTATLLNAFLTRNGLPNTVSTLETTGSTTYVDLATVGPTVTITSQGTLAVVFFGCRMFAAAAAGVAMSVAVSGATTVAASDSFAWAATHDATGLGFRGYSIIPLTITPGSNTFTAKYRVTGSTGSFVDRRMWVLAP